MDDRLARVRPLLDTRQNRQFTDDPVDEADLYALTEVARWSGSSANSQPWRFIVLHDVSLIRQIAGIGMPSTRSLQTAPAGIAIVLPDEEKRAVSRAYDDGRVAERLLIGAGMLDLDAGIAWVPTEARPQVRNLLGVPADRFVRTIVAVGHATAAGRAPKAAPGAARLSREELVMEERWR